MELGLDAWATVGIIVVMMFVLVRELARPDLTLLGCLAFLLVFGILTPEEAFAGFSNKAVLAVGALLVVAAGVQNTGAIEFVDRTLFPKSKNLPVATARLMIATASLSAFLNNTPIVAMLMPRVRAWCERMRVPPSKLMIPLSYGAIVGGMTTLIGTSTNLLVSGLMEASGYPALGLFDFAWVGAPAAICTIVYFSLVGHRLLPDRGVDQAGLGDSLQEALVELRVGDNSSLRGLSVEDAGPQELEDAYIVHLRREEHVIPASPGIVLQAGDVLALAGGDALLERLLEKHGLEQVDGDGVFGKKEDDSLLLYEAVVAPTSILVGKTLRDVRFRQHYQGVVIEIYRSGTAIEGPIGRVPIMAGDLLVIEAGPGFQNRWSQSRAEFYIVTLRDSDRVKPSIGRASLALAIFVGVVLLAAFGVAEIVTTAFVGALAMVVTGCLSWQDVRRAIDIPVLLVIASALGLGKAIEVTGLAASIGHFLTDQTAILGSLGIVIAVYIATSLLTEMITNNAAAALMVGVGLVAAQDLGVPPEAFGIAVAIAASASFLTPIGYQTNLMVLTAGGYRFSDFAKSGILVNLMVSTTAILVIWLKWL